MKKSVLTAAALVIAVGTVVAVASSVSAYKGDPQVMGPNCDEETHEQMSQIMENGDYQAWKELRQGKGRIDEVINEDNFNRFVEMHQLRVEGKDEEANQIREELGLGLRDGSGQRRGMGEGRGRDR